MFWRNQRFLEDELANLLATLLYPEGNALLYRAALQCPGATH